MNENERLSGWWMGMDNNSRAIMQISIRPLQEELNIEKKSIQLLQNKPALFKISVIQNIKRKKR